MRLTIRQRRLLAHDVAVFLGALAATDLLSADHLSRAVVLSSLVTAVKVAARQLLPVPPPE